MSHSIEDQTLALAGVAQAAVLVRGLAYKGSAPQSALEGSIRSLFAFDAADTADVFGGPQGVALGLKQLRQSLGGQDRDVDLTRYAMILLQLGSRFMQAGSMPGQVHDRLVALAHDWEREGLTDGLFIEINGLYRDTISNLTPKVVVNGEQSLLEQREIAARIRALLLAGIRAAVLWQQVGGSRLQLLFRRKRYLEACESLLRRSIGTV
ncbi:MAG: high frequency lysogenization protein HflD [Halothiobacillaceae bacterium]